MLDPAISLIIKLGFTLLLVGAGGHKLTNRIQFRAILQAYQILPVALVPLAGLMLGMFELVLGFVWAAGWQATPAAWATALLLAAYALAISINLMRGRSYIDCGCGFASAIGRESKREGIQQLSISLVLRNAVLIAGALVVTLPSTDRLLGIMDYLFAVLACLVLILFYGAFNQLLINDNAIRSWRRADG